MKKRITSAINKVPKNCVMLLSGGLDSFIIWRLLGQPKAVYFAIGHKAEENELEKLLQIDKTFSHNSGNILVDSSLKWLGKYELPSGYIPYRNLLFIMRASFYSPNIVIAQTLEYAPDKNKSFYRKVERLLKKITTGKFQEITPQNVKIYAPFSEFTKTELVEAYIEKYKNLDDLSEFTISCYSGKDINCGKCSACFHRYVSMMNNGILERYEVEPKAPSKKWNIKDFKLFNLRMYIKRWLEMQNYL
jgi:7-cyano-7-deazaguanine synthase in queuosine biosynthesis